MDFFDRPVRLYARVRLVLPPRKIGTVQALAGQLATVRLDDADTVTVGCGALVLYTPPVGDLDDVRSF